MKYCVYTSKIVKVLAHLEEKSSLKYEIFSFEEQITNARKAGKSN